MTRAARSKPGRKRVRPRKAPPGRCIYQYCKLPAIRDTIRCQKHLDETVKMNREASRYRRQLGFCKSCRERAEPGYTRCRKHLDESRATHQRWRDRNVQERGWKLVKVPIR